MVAFKESLFAYCSVMVTLGIVVSSPAVAGRHLRDVSSRLSSAFVTFHQREGYCWRHSKRRRQPSAYSTSTACFLNRFLFRPPEVVTRPTEEGEDGDVPTVTLPIDDYRTVHAANVLGVRNGDTVRAGVVIDDESDVVEHDDRLEGMLTDEAVVEWIPEGKVKKAEPLARSGKPPGSLKLYLRDLKPAQTSNLPSPVSLILALPRPLQLGRMLPMVSQMGVDRLVLTGAQKVPKDYFGSHLFRNPDQLTGRLLEGLCQSGTDVRLPRVSVSKSLSKFLGAELDQLFPRDEYARVVAHPQRRHDNDKSYPPKRMRQIRFPDEDRPRLVVAVGPEGGWAEPEELDLLCDAHDFQQVTMGARALRRDCAVVSLICLAHDVVCHRRSSSSSVPGATKKDDGLHRPTPREI